MITRNRRDLRCGALTAVLALAACSSPFAPSESVAVYDVTTQLQTFSFETGAPSPPDCPGYTLYCTHTRAFDGASLVGTLTITRDSVYGHFGGLFCSAWGLGGCVGVKSMPALDYSYYTGTKVIRGSGPSSIWLRGPDEFDPLVGFSATASGDSLYGPVYWSQSVGRSPPTHYGTFVARLRR